MSDMTVKQLAGVLGMPVTKLLKLLREAGLAFNNESQVISATEKVRLLGYLRKRYATTPVESRQILLPRRVAKESTIKSQQNEERAGVFVVHGHDEVLKEQLSNYLHKVGLDPIILHEQANRGRSLLDKFSDHGAVARFAIVLMTADDEGGPAGSGIKEPRARPNVIFELGWFLAKLGRENVAVLVKGKVSPPSDFNGIAYISADNISWQIDLGKELRAAGVPFNGLALFQ